MRLRLIVLVCLLFTGSAVGVLPTVHAEESPSENQLIAYLSGVEKFPAAAEWRAFGPKASAILIRVAEDREEWPTRRTRAVDALAYFGGPEVKKALAGLLNRPSRNPMNLIDPTSNEAESLVKRRVLQSLAQAFGSEAVPLIQPFLTDRDALIRETAVTALAATKSPDALPLLESRQAREPEPFVRATIQKELERLKKD